MFVFMQSVKLRLDLRADWRLETYVEMHFKARCETRYYKLASCSGWMLMQDVNRGSDVFWV